MHAPAKFINGSILKHVITMAFTNAIGLTAIFAVDLVDIYFITQLNDPSLTASIGFCSAILFFSTAISIGFATANTAIVSKCIGKNNRQLGARLSTHACLFTFIISLICTLFIYFLAPFLLSLLGASGAELSESVNYLRIITISIPILALTMQLNATLRSLGEAKYAMYSVLLVALINILLDPLFIFVMALNLEGAAVTSVLARLTGLIFTIVYLHYRFNMFTFKQIKYLAKDIKQIASIAFPTTITQLVTPIGNLYITYEIAKYGSLYMAGWAIVGRIIPIAFAVMFAISGAIAPIIGQNYGAKQFSRVKEVLSESLKFTTAYTLVVALLLSLFQENIIVAFSVGGDAALMVRIFCQHIAITFIFTGMLFIAMAFFNNLGFAKYATTLNIAKLCLGTIPFVMLGSNLFLAPGILYAQALANISFAIIAIFLTLHLMKRVKVKI